MQTHQILFNPRFTGTTVGIQSDLVAPNGYLVHVQEVNGGGVVSKYDVRGFLANEKNESITTAFDSYLRTNTSNSQYNEIFYNDKKLADVFNVFYETTVLGNAPTSSAIIIRNLEGTVQLTAVDSDYPYAAAKSPTKALDYIPQDIKGKTRIGTNSVVTTTFTSEQSYYIPIFLNRNFQDISLQVSEGNVDNLMINSTPYEQGFVDLNLQANEDSFWSDDSIENSSSGIGLESSLGTDGSDVEIPEDTGPPDTVPDIETSVDTVNTDSTEDFTYFTNQENNITTIGDNDVRPIPEPSNFTYETDQTNNITVILIN